MANDYTIPDKPEWIDLPDPPELYDVLHDVPKRPDDVVKLRALWRRGRQVLLSFHAELDRVQKDLGNDELFAKWCFWRLHLSLSILQRNAELLDKVDADRVKLDLKIAGAAEKQQKAAEKAARDAANPPKPPKAPKPAEQQPPAAQPAEKPLSLWQQAAAEANAQDEEAKAAAAAAKKAKNSGTHHRSKRMENAPDYAVAAIEAGLVPEYIVDRYVSTWKDVNPEHMHHCLRMEIELGKAKQAQQETTGKRGRGRPRNDSASNTAAAPNGSTSDGALDAADKKFLKELKRRADKVIGTLAIIHMPTAEKQEAVFEYGRIVLAVILKTGRNYGKYLEEHGMVYGDKHYRSNAKWLAKNESPALRQALADCSYVNPSDIRHWLRVNAPELIRDADDDPADDVVGEITNNEFGGNEAATLH